MVIPMTKKIKLSDVGHRLLALLVECEQHNQPYFQSELDELQTKHNRAKTEKEQLNLWVEFIWWWGGQNATESTLFCNTEEACKELAEHITKAPSDHPRPFYDLKKV